MTKEDLYKAHRIKLNTLLHGFFKFLEQTPKPTDEDVRTEFIKREKHWLQYCATNNLDIQTATLFNLKVSCEWRKKYAQTNQ